MYRSGDAPSGLIDTVEDATRRLEDLNRSHGEGAAALRNKAGHVLELDPGSQRPLLTPVGVDSGFRFDDGAVQIRNGTGDQPADLGVKKLNATGGASISGDITGVVRASVDNLSITGNSIWSYPYDGAVRWGTDGAFDICNRSGSEYRGIRSSNFATVAPSWREMKTGHRSVVEHLGATAGEVVDGLEVGGWRYDPEHPEVTEELAASGEHFGLMLDGLPMTLRRRHVVVDDDGAERVVWSYDRDDVLNLALAAVQETRAELAALRAYIEHRQ